jgi:hypothetical protein
MFYHHYIYFYLIRISMKKVLYLSLVASSVFSMQLDIVKQQRSQLVRSDKLQEKLYQLHSHTLINGNKSYIQPSSVHAPYQLGDIELYHGKKGFTVLKGNEKHVIEQRFMDSITRNIPKERLNDFLEHGYFSIDRTHDGLYTIKAIQREKGGGIIGVAIGAFLGKAVVSVVGHGAIFIIGGLTGPAAPYTIIALESCFGAAIESTSMAAAVAGGIALGVATGPV